MNETRSNPSRAKLKEPKARARGEKQARDPTQSEAMQKEKEEDLEDLDLA
jgi:hypothetical protein